MYYVYVLYSESFQRYYKGFCQNLFIRLSEHNSGKTKSTKPFIPWEIVYTENYENKNDAIAREKYLKTAAGRKFLKNVVLKNKI